MAGAESAPGAADTPASLVFVDLETTGGNPAQHRITEIGIIRVDNGVQTDEWSSLVNPECPIPPYIQSFTGISNQMVEHAPRFADLAATVLEKLGGAVFVAHNARFDYGFLRSEFRKAKIHFSADVLCTVKLSRRLFPGFARHNLDAVMERHALNCNARHRALGDARLIRDFWLKMREETPRATLTAAAQLAMLSVARLPAHLPPQLADELPEGPGVYRCFGENDALLYVGRSNSLRGHVLAQLSDEHAGSRDHKLAGETRRVDWLETAGELGAMLREAQWLRTSRPSYNRRAKAHGDSATLRPGTGGSGRIEVRRIDALDASDLADSFGVFHSEKDARKALTDIAHARQLCLKVLGVEPGEGSCFAFQVGKCRGACVGKESLLLHGMRVQLALSALKIKRWPFPGRIALRERRPRADGAGGSRSSSTGGGGWAEGERSEDYHVLEQWAYLGTARCAEELAALSGQNAPLAFDVDVYRMLTRYFADHPQLDWHSAQPRPAAEPWPSAS